MNKLLKTLTLISMALLVSFNLYAEEGQANYFKLGMQGSSVSGYGISFTSVLENKHEMQATFFGQVYHQEIGENPVLEKNANSDFNFGLAYRYFFAEAYNFELGIFAGSMFEFGEYDSSDIQSSELSRRVSGGTGLALKLEYSRLAVHVDVGLEYDYENAKEYRSDYGKKVPIKTHQISPCGSIGIGFIL